MTEVRLTPGRGSGLYCTNGFKTGDIVLEESPLFTFSPTTKDQALTIQAQFKPYSKSSNAKVASKSRKDRSSRKDETSTLLDKLQFPSKVAKEQVEKFRSMLIAAGCYALFGSTNQDLRTKILDLYSPSPTSNIYEQPILDLSHDAVEFLKTNTESSSPLCTFATKSPEDCQKVMLVWACNAFQGGAVYHTASRINHSCDFNCTASNSLEKSPKNNGRQVFRAVCDIQPGTEITISYLGSYVFSDYLCRNSILERDKYFHCSCERCCKEDVAGAIPCPSCHHRDGRYLDEDVQYDDDGQVQYANPHYSNDTSTKIAYWKCPNSKNDTKYDTKEEQWINAFERTQEKVKNYIDETNSGIHDEDLAMLEKMYYLSFSVLGSKHWMTNLLGVSRLSKQLEYIHSVMLCASTGQKQGGRKSTGDDEDNPLNEESIAECCDSLQRLWAFVEGLDMQCHPGHLLGSVTIGIARALVGLGDEESMRYGGKWAGKVDDGYYAKGFEGEGMIKVVETLKNAWKRKADETRRPKKKSRR